jgi:excinuclease ABC subunit C
VYRADGEPVELEDGSLARNLIQQIRDEAHRFAITGHRQRRDRKRKSSVLESIPGLGPHRRRALLQRFGGLQGIARAGPDDLARTRGISRELAARIYGHFHESAPDS